MPLTYANPHEAGLASSAKSICKRIATLLNALSDINPWVCDGTMIGECFDYKRETIKSLEAEGWRIAIKGNKYTVKPPVNYPDC